MQTKVVLKAINPVGGSIQAPPGGVTGTPQYQTLAVTFQAQNFPADGKVADDYVHLMPTAPLVVTLPGALGKDLRLGGEYVLTLTPA